ncbi:HEAT repeat domain-containing protein [Pseudokineococcus sp. 1T1Z-3]|uniref:HEAT repeat domain-containing protein n=1 Tax=Pseudokineococcus sp. 1T1Z-3 TaxID=3132745 RepID=UPI00403F3BDE
MLRASRSDDCQVRAAAGRLLVAGIGDREIEQAPRRLVDDPDDTSVTQEVAEELASTGGEAGLRLLLGCLAEMTRTGRPTGSLAPSSTPTASRAELVRS